VKLVELFEINKFAAEDQHWSLVKGSQSVCRATRLGGKELGYGDDNAGSVGMSGGGMMGSLGPTAMNPLLTCTQTASLKNKKRIV